MTKTQSVCCFDVTCTKSCALAYEVMSTRVNKSSIIDNIHLSPDLKHKAVVHSTAEAY